MRTGDILEATKGGGALLDARLEGLEANLLEPLQHLGLVLLEEARLVVGEFEMFALLTVRTVGATIGMMTKLVVQLVQRHDRLVQWWLTTTNTTTDGRCLCFVHQTLLSSESSGTILTATTTASTQSTRRVSIMTVCHRKPSQSCLPLLRTILAQS